MLLSKKDLFLTMTPKGKAATLTIVPPARREVSHGRGSSRRFDEDGWEAQWGTSSSTMQVKLMRLLVIVMATLAARWAGLPSHVRNPTDLYLPAYRVGLTASAVSLIVILLVLFWKHVVQRGVSYKHLRMRARRPILVIVTSGTVAFFSLSLAFWPIYGIKGPFLFAIISYGVLCSLSFV